MTVGELIGILQQYPPGFEVVLSKDAEGNCFSPLADVGPGEYTPESNWSGEFTEQDVQHNAVCLWPIN